MAMLERLNAPEELPSPEVLLRSWRGDATEEKMELCHKVWRGKSNKDVYLFGRNEASEILLSKDFRCSGVIDDFTSETTWNGIHVKRFDQIAGHESVVVNCVHNSKPVEAASRIASHNKLRALSFSDFFRAGLLENQDMPAFCASTQHALRRNPILYSSLWQELADESSRAHFHDILCYRITTDPWFMRHYTYRPEDQYFEHFLKLPSSPVFVDVGAFHGETSLEFAKRYPQYSKIHAFEPSHTNADACIQQTSDLRNICLSRVGLSDALGRVRFASQLGSASRASEDGDVSIQVMPLDDLELTRVDLIKMDLEGGEMRALQGAAKTITLCEPRLAIAAYHKPEDFSLLHQFMQQLLPDSSFYLRHYTSGWAETVLYCVPR